MIVYRRLCPTETLIVQQRVPFGCLSCVTRLPDLCCTPADADAAAAAEHSGIRSPAVALAKRMSLWRSQ